MTNSFFHSSKLSKMALIFCFSFSNLPLTSTPSLQKETSFAFDSFDFPHFLTSFSFTSSLEHSFPMPLKEPLYSFISENKEESAIHYEKPSANFIVSQPEKILEQPTENVEPSQEISSLVEAPSLDHLETPDSLEVWSISYIPWRDALNAPEDGSIGLWADGWFIVHRTTPNGQKIASFVSQIEVDGQLYVLDDTWVTSDEITLDEIKRIRANQGITFQTCIDETTNQMVHYRPAPGQEGYPYTFSHYPYTTNDTLAIGYTPGLDGPSEDPLYDQPSEVEYDWILDIELPMVEETLSFAADFSFQDIEDEDLFQFEKPEDDFLFLE